MSSLSDGGAVATDQLAFVGRRRCKHCASYFGVGARGVCGVCLKSIPDDDDRRWATWAQVVLRSLPDTTSAIYMRRRELGFTTMKLANVLAWLETRGRIRLEGGLWYVV